jgi:hypothetical protein
MTTTLQKVRCPQCGKTEGCGWDAYSEWNPLTQATVLGGEYDDGWCSDCGDIEPVFYTPEGDELAELVRQIAEHEAAERLKGAASDLLAALEAVLRAPSIGSSGPGSISIEVQTFNLDAARAAIDKARGRA